MNELYDIAIIGSGVAGLQAAINATIRKKNIIVFGNKNLSTKLVKSHRIDNYLGFYGKSGSEIAQAFQEHIQAMNIEITEEKITAVYPNGDSFMLAGAGNMYEARKVILASGVELTRSIENEADFLGMGVSYCATCDAPLYKGRSVVVVGYSEESIHEANYIAEIAEHVDFVPVNVKTDDLKSSINIVKDVPLRIEGEQSATRLVLKNQTLNTDGIFVLRDSVEPSQLVNGLEIEDGHIKVNRQMETNFHGLFAAGDCTGKPYQYMKAAGEGHVAGLSAVDQIDKENAGIQ